jgi:predicted PhzF superfamily epimerase YddE/YHI9
MGFQIFQVDAFTGEAFGGNPAAVCYLTESRDTEWMQRVGSEMDLSETAFLEKRDDGWGLRWFTPAIEVDLCGHATLASAHVLWETGALDPVTEARFWTRSGLLTCTRQGSWIEMDFPATPPVEAAAPAGTLEALGANAIYVGRSRFDYLIEVASEAEVRALRPDHAALRKLDTRGVIVTSRSDSPSFDFVSRFFAPAAGIDEDPATGSAHCALAPYWQQKLGKSEMTGYQASPRGGTVKVSMRGDRVGLGGQAVTVLKGELLA